MRNVYLLLSFILMVCHGTAQTDSVRYPYPVHYLNLSIQQQHCRMAYMDVKPDKANGRAIVLLHGKNFNGAYWSQTAQALAAEGYRVIIPDQIGFGRSTQPAHLQYSFRLLAANTKLLLDTLGIKEVCVLGHSMGGMLAIRFALSYPAITQKLILADPIGLEDYGALVPYQGADERYRVELSQTRDKLKKYEQESYYHGTWRPGYDEWLDSYAVQFQRSDYPLIAWNAALTYDMIMTQPVCHELQNIKVRTMLIIGQRDKAAVGKEYAPDSIKAKMGDYPLLGRAAHEKIKGSRLVELDGVGHLPQVEDFDKFIAAVKDFLK